MLWSRSRAMKQVVQTSRGLIWLGLLLTLLTLGLSWVLVSPITLVHLGANDGGGTVTVQVGQKLDLDLGAGYSAPRSSDTAVLGELASSESCLGVEGCQRYHFVALRPGAADLVSYRRAVCKPGEMCMLFVMLFTIHIQVSP